MNPHVTRRTQDFQNQRDELFSGRNEDSSHTSIYIDEDQFMNNTQNNIDDYVSLGENLVNDLRQQGDMLKRGRKRVLDTANTLGLSSNVIRYIEKRSNQDKIIFWICIIVTVFIIYLIVHYLKRS
jgi:Golgi SNAP receptor complex protein 2